MESGDVLLSGDGDFLCNRDDRDVFLLLLLFFTGDGLGTGGGEWEAFLSCGDLDLFLCLVGDLRRGFSGDFFADFFVFVRCGALGGLDGLELVAVVFGFLAFWLAAAFGVGIGGGADVPDFGGFAELVAVFVADLLVSCCVFFNWLRMTLTSAACKACPDVRSPMRVRRSWSNAPLASAACNAA